MFSLSLIPIDWSLVDLPPVADRYRITNEYARMLLAQLASPLTAYAQNLMSHAATQTEASVEPGNWNIPSTAVELDGEWDPVRMYA